MSMQSCQEDSVILYGLNRFYLGIHACIQAYMHAITVTKTRVHLKESGKRYVGGYGWGKEKAEMLKLYYDLKT